jgi:hypothetical protein
MLGEEQANQQSAGKSVEDPRELQLNLGVVDTGHPSIVSDSGHNRLKPEINIYRWNPGLYKGVLIGTNEISLVRKIVRIPSFPPQAWQADPESNVLLQLQ